VLEHGLNIECTPLCGQPACADHLACGLAAWGGQAADAESKTPLSSSAWKVGTASDSAANPGSTRGVPLTQSII
jgi:hypothetical protein